MRDDFDPKRFAWARSKFDIEGLAGAIAAWLVGILLGIVWDPLFWIGAIAAILILLATRRSNRTRPISGEGDAVVAPVDGVVVTVEPADPPSELRYPAPSAMRIRISSSPASQNRVFAPAAGTLASVIQESGSESQPVAMDADAHGLFNAYLTFEAAIGPVGPRLVTGGLGPRVDLDARDGDTVGTGDVIGKRRLGGWCDVYLPEGSPVAVVAGQTLVGAETRLTTANGAPRPATARDEATYADETPGSATDGPDPRYPAGVATAPAAGSPVAEPSGTDTEEASDASQLETLTAEEGEDPAELFARLRSRVEDAGKTDGET